MVYKRLGEMLIANEYITPEQLNKALEIQKKSTGKKLGEILVEQGFTTQRRVYKALERQLGVEFVDLTGMVIPKEMTRLVPRSIARKYNVVPVQATQDSLSLAMADPLNFVATDAVRMIVKRKVVPMLATAEAITRTITDLYGSESAEKALQDLKSNEDETTTDFQNIAAANVIGADSENAAPTIRLVNSFLEYAVNQNCSDIHLEPRESAMYVRMRIDGVLRQVFVVPKNTQSAVIARIKVMGNMNIAEHKIPLDGRSNVRIGEKDVDLRISTLPTVYGEKVVIRLLNKSSSLLNTKGIGLVGKNLAKFNALLENSNGVILIVGPTGSGKSSSMYTMIGKLNTEQVNLVTLEDPVEYNFDGVNQVQINEKTGMTFASGLRSILRQDPDIIAVGEIRDGETADIAMRAAITGHLVLSTLHTNDAPSTIDRLLDMGVESFLISSALKGIISQRLVRRICPNCRTEYTPSAEEQQMLRLPVQAGRRFYRGKGCPMCFGTGYRGRTAVFEILVLNSAVRHAIADNVPHSQLQELIRESDFEPLIVDCVRLVQNGTTTVEEAYRTVNSTDI
ncbi:MAG: Flp pilus assembly complex ATPase component TadA [Oscillospiraceae bacterium]|nr:Flp pilus assembly complex ATPase component TadA [Oscillospiraceae bacterium]